MSVQYKFLVSVVIAMVSATNVRAWETNWPTLVELTNATDQASGYGPWVWNSWASQCWHAVYERLQCTGQQYKDIGDLGHDEGMIFRWDKHVYESEDSDPNRSWFYDDTGRTNTAVWNHAWYLSSNPGGWTNTAGGVYQRYPHGIKDAISHNFFGVLEDDYYLAWVEPDYKNALIDETISTGVTTNRWAGYAYLLLQGLTATDSTNWMMDDLFANIGVPTNTVDDQLLEANNNSVVYPVAPAPPYWTYSGYPYVTTGLNTTNMAIATNAHTYGNFGVGAYSYPSLYYALTNLTHCIDPGLRWIVELYEGSCTGESSWADAKAAAESDYSLTFCATDNVYNALGKLTFDVKTTGGYDGANDYDASIEYFRVQALGWDQFELRTTNMGSGSVPTNELNVYFHGSKGNGDTFIDIGPNDTETGNSITEGQWQLIAQTSGAPPDSGWIGSDTWDDAPGTGEQELYWCTEPSATNTDTSAEADYTPMVIIDMYGMENYR